MTYSEVVALLTSSVHGVRKAVYGVQVREYIARSMEALSRWCGWVSSG